MNLPPLNLDDRRFDDLVEEAKRRIAAKCPRWTDFNPSDPGMMLVELMAWMTETVLYRLNRVPEQNYIKFLDLIGVRLQPARPARTWVFFQVKEKSDEDAIAPVEKGTQVSTRPQREQEPVTFVTRDAIRLTTARIVKTCSRYSPKVVGESARTVNEIEVVHSLHQASPWETEIFALPRGDSSRGTAVPHNLYFGDPALGEPLLVQYWNQLELQVIVDLEEALGGQVLLEWEAWDGRDWRIVIPESDATQGFKMSGGVVFTRLPALDERALSELSGGQVASSGSGEGGSGDPRWLRARVIGSEVESLPKLRRVQRRIDLKDCVVPPWKAFAQSPAPEELPEKVEKNLPSPLPPPPLQSIDISADFYPFGTKVIPGVAFYLGSELFQKHGATIAIRFDLRKALKPRDELEAVWEFRSVSGDWRMLGRSTQAGGVGAEFQFHDETHAFTQSGRVDFLCPEDFHRTELGGQSGWYIRVRIEKGTFENDSNAQLIVRSVLLGFTNERRDWARIVSENYSTFKVHRSASHLQPFDVDPKQDPAFYVCFSNRPSTERNPHRLFLDVVPQQTETKGARMQWEYSASHGGWEALTVVTDGTEGFAREGALDFISPPEWKERTEFQQSGYWLRVRWGFGELGKPPRLRRVLLNGVEVEQAVPASRVLGSSNGMPCQSLSLETSILDYPEVWVRESDDGLVREKARLQAEGELEMGSEVRMKSDGLPVDWPDGCWVRWLERRNLFRSDRNHRHFTVDLGSGTILFGDGIQGRIPPRGANNIAARYRVTQGSRGNVGRNTITVLETKVPQQIQAVTNVHAAGGGCDRETMEKAMQRGPWEIKHVNRAVTREDFIQLAMKASQLVAKAECIEDQGTVRVIIVPHEDAERPQPGRRLIEDVKSYLDDKRLINTRLGVQGPTYEPVDVEVKVALEHEHLTRFGEIRLQIEKRLREFVHPLKGMQNGRGWIMGRTLHLSELYYRLEDGIDGIDHVEKVRMCRAGTGLWEEKIAIDCTSFPCFSQHLKIQQSGG